ncbi:succinate dehydrogenase / fumarate reductase cytochrome b subunit [Catalinimonas alkaloidigena]|uniref:Succinate dehydrogenase / fumarate reductase cytochrome b subunit n=1 Tax=Catalinimonas alkaloidigena TaxID=1075417 RepID=A0A1G9PP13_9BACT|nr:succinate dehydrogenase cytochrome b subunit [Catalinimonas alkaloidigena]SDL99967.1 succinate dehydrogenase / fumarate reductase cytochrome b subunit [Catalinimonas alkaloidigena]
MTWFTRAVTSSIGQKVLMSLTGLFLVSFLFVHLSGNFLLFADDGGRAFNEYSKFMTSAAIIRVMEIVLLLGIVLHVYTATTLTRRNAQARPQKYAYTQPSPGVSWFSRNMGISGSIVLIFLVIHIQNFWYRYKFGEPGVDAWGNRDMYTLVATTFRVEWWYSILYILAMVLLAFHLNHGFQSAFRTLGLNHPKYLPVIKGTGTFLAILFPIAFAVFPIYFLFFN